MVAFFPLMVVLFFVFVWIGRHVPPPEEELVVQIEFESEDENRPAPRHK